MVTSSDNKPYLQDAIVTLRDGRFVIPVKQEHRSRFPGMVHDQSKGGQTLFIEPQAIVEMNNRLRELEVEDHAGAIRPQRLSRRGGEARARARLVSVELQEPSALLAKGTIVLYQKDASHVPALQPLACIRCCYTD